MNELIQDLKEIEIITQRFDAYLLGVKHGKTMAEVDTHYEELLREIKELEKSLKRIKAAGEMYKKMEVSNGKTDRKAVDQGV